MNVKQLMDYGKKFIIIGNGNAVAYKDIFPYIMENKLWLGVSPRGLDFILPNGGTSNVYAVWFTNVEHKKHNTPIDLYKRYSNEYPKYDNYDAIEVSKTCDIPMDYDGVMGVPITFLDKYCPTQFEIIGLFTEANGDCFIQGKETYTDEAHKNSKCPVLNKKRLYPRLLIRKVK